MRLQAERKDIYSCEFPSAKTGFSWDFTVTEEAQPIAEIDVSAWRERGVLVVEGMPYQVYREGLVSGAFILESAGSVLARAVKPSAFRRSFTIEYADREYTFCARSALGRAFLLLDGLREIGSLTPEGILTRRTKVDLPHHLPLPVRVFMIWLAIILWKRDSESSSGGGAE